MLEQYAVTRTAVSSTEQLLLKWIVLYKSWLRYHMEHQQVCLNSSTQMPRNYLEFRHYGPLSNFSFIIYTDPVICR